jgi:hypothetical protein
VDLWKLLVGWGGRVSLFSPRLGWLFYRFACFLPTRGTNRKE